MRRQRKKEYVSISHCPHCGEVLRMQVSIFVELPSTAFRHLRSITASKLSNAIQGADWPNAVFFCSKGHYAWYMGKTTFGDTLRQQRKIAGITMGEMARHLNITTTLLSKVERNECAPLPERLIRQAAKRMNASAEPLLCLSKFNEED